MFKALLIGVVLGAVLVLGGLWLYFTSGRAPVAVTDPPLPFEKKIARTSIRAHLAKQEQSDPAVPANETNFLAGAEVYKQNCAVCHGLPDTTASTISQGMYPKPPQLFEGTGVTDDPVWQTHWFATNGIRTTGMPGFKGRLSDTQLWQVSQLLANADKISPTVRAALIVVPGPATPASPTAVAPAKSK
jgi:thiosulfate dehydrogenase